MSRYATSRNFQFQLYLSAKPYSSQPPVSISHRPGHSCVAIAPRLAVQLSGFVCVSPPNSLLADTPPSEMASERSIRCLSWFASFVASLSGGTIDTRKGRLQNTMRRLRGHKLRSPRKRLARTGRWDFRKGDAGCPNRYVISNQRQ